MKLLKPIRNSFKKAGIKIVRARQRRAAEELAYYLILENPDFRNVSRIDLVNAILSKKEVKWHELAR